MTAVCRTLGTMVSTRLSLRAAILFSVIAVGEVAASGSGSGAVLKKHRKRGRCSPPHTSSSPALSLTSSDLTLHTSTSTFETIVIPTTTFETEGETETATSSIEETTISIPGGEATASSVEETTTTLPVEETTTSSVEETTTTVSAEEPITSSIEETTTTSNEEAITSTTEAIAVPTITEGPTSTSELPITTTSTTICEPTVATWAPELCWRSVPNRCSSLTITTLAAPSVTAHAVACNSALRGYDAQLAPEVSSCFSNLDQPAGFNPTSAYSCISSASIYCSATSACAPVATSAPLIPAFTNPGFESGDFGSWYEIPGATPNNLVGTISTENAHNGSYSLKLQFNNLASDYVGFAHRVRFEPGGRYEFSFWYYHLALATGTLALRVEFPGTNLPLVIQMNSQGVNRWLQQKFTLVPSTSFGTFSVTYQSTKQTFGDTIYIDDVTMTKVG